MDEMGRKTLLQSLPDRRRIAVLLRADGADYEEIAAFLNISLRQARYEIEHATADLAPGLLDHRREENVGRTLRLLYLMGASDGGATLDDLPGMLDSLVERAHWLRTRMAVRARRMEQRRS